MNKEDKVYIGIAAIIFIIIIVLSQIAKANPSKIENRLIPSGDGGDAFKPVIYLDGYNRTNVTVTLDLNGKLTMTYPKPSQTESHAEWDVLVTRDNQLKANDKYVRYLFWEGKLNTAFDFSEGFCIKGSDIPRFLEETSKTLGLNDQETEDFVTYWAPQMIKNPYNVISFQSEAYTDAAKLIVLPKPDTEIRIFMAWYPTNEPVEIQNQTLTPNRRSGRTVIEWGGSIADQNAIKRSHVLSATIDQD